MPDICSSSLQTTSNSDEDPIVRFWSLSCLYAYCTANTNNSIFVLKWIVIKSAFTMNYASTSQVALQSCAECRHCRRKSRLWIYNTNGLVICTASTADLTWTKNNFDWLQKWIFEQCFCRGSLAPVNLRKRQERYVKEEHDVSSLRFHRSRRHVLQNHFPNTTSWTVLQSAKLK